MTSYRMEIPPLAIGTVHDYQFYFINNVSLVCSSIAKHYYNMVPVNDLKFSG